MRRILLFDMDNVLVTPRGYHLALTETVERVSRSIGLPPLRVTREQVTRFEASGASSEWDSSAICAALLLAHVWRDHPDVRLPDAPPLPGDLRTRDDLPDLDRFLELFSRQGETADPRGRAGQLLLSEHPRLSAAQREVLHELLAHARDIEHSLTHRLFQELVLGTKLFVETYRIPPALQVETGYLLAHDEPGVGPDLQDALRRWLAVDGHGAAVFTNRPSLWPDGSRGTPEAEQGTHVVNLPGLPVVGLGGLRWLATSLGLSDAEAYLKPSPVHALAAMLAATGGPVATALEQAASREASWSALDGAAVWVFEDSDWGLRSAVAASELLAARGVKVSLRLCGVTASPSKQARLRAAGAEIFDTLPQALATVDGLRPD
jgi:hypothetical protein